MARYLSEGKSDLHEVLMDFNDEGISIEHYKKEAAKIKAAVISLLAQIKGSSTKIDDSFLREKYDEQALFDFSKYITRAIGYDPAKGGYGRVLHPFTAMLGPKDARITTNCSTYSIGVLAAMHEAGHAMYACGGSEDADSRGLWGGIMGGFHEGQSRFFENVIGRGKAFWTHHYAEVQSRFDNLKGISLDEYFAGINKVRLNIRRIQADEVSYCLHPILRVELEAELFSGSLRFDDLSDAWNGKYEAYLGLRPKNDAEGVLQDVHWAVGSIGYFQSYTLGNMYCGQILNTLKKAVPDFDTQVSRGDLSQLNAWMDEHIRKYGAAFTADEMIRQATGEPLNADYYIAYLKDKYNALYGLTKYWPEEGV
jgi:carboxypeptidase Taq